MKKYQIVLANFFTAEKRISTIRVKDHSELEERVEIIAKINPECVIAAYLDGEIQLATRPRLMMEEKEMVKNQGSIEQLEFFVRWRIILGSGGDQVFPDYSLPENTSSTKKPRRRKSTQMSKPVRRTSKGKRAPHIETFQMAAGI